MEKFIKHVFISQDSDPFRTMHALILTSAFFSINDVLAEVPVICCENHWKIAVSWDVQRELVLWIFDVLVMVFSHPRLVPGTVYIS